MLYTVNSTNSNILQLSGSGYQFRFNHLGLFFFSDGYLQDPQAIQYFPTPEDKEALLKEYTEWCEKYKQPQNAELLALLKGV